MRKLLLLAAFAGLLGASIPAVAGAAPTYCYAAKPGGEGGCVYKAPAAETVRLTGVGGWNVIYGHKKKVKKTYSSPNPEVPTTFTVDVAKGDTLTLGITHIGSAIVLTADQ